MSKSISKSKSKSFVASNFSYTKRNSHKKKLTQQIRTEQELSIEGKVHGFKLTAEMCSKEGNLRDISPFTARKKPNVISQNVGKSYRGSHYFKGFEDILKRKSSVADVGGGMYELSKNLPTDNKVNKSSLGENKKKTLTCHELTNAY